MFLQRFVQFRSIGCKITEFQFPITTQFKILHTSLILNQEAQTIEEENQNKKRRNPNSKVRQNLTQQKTNQQQIQHIQQKQKFSKIKEQKTEGKNDIQQQENKQQQQFVSLIDFLVDGDIQKTKNVPKASTADRTEVANIMGDKRLKKIKSSIVDARNKPANFIMKDNLTETRIYLREKLQISAEDVERVCRISSIATQTVKELEPKIEVMVKHLNLSRGRLGELVVNQPKIFTIQKPDRMERRLLFWVHELEAADGLFFNNPWVLGIPISVVQRKLDLINTLNWSKDSKKLLRSCPPFINMGLNQIEERMQELEEILDMDRERVVDVLQRYPIILNHQPAFLEERVISWFKRKGFESETIADLIRSQPRMLLGNVHLLKRNWATLHMLGLGTDLVKRVFKYCGQVFRVSLEKETQLCKLRYIQMRLERNPQQVLQQFPLLFQYDLWFRIAPRIYLLQSRKLNTHNLMKFMIPGNRKFAILKARSNVDLYQEWLFGEWKYQIMREEKEKVQMWDVPLFHTNY